MGGGGGNPGGGLDVDSLQAAGDRLVVAQVQFSPNPVTEQDGADHRARSRDGSRRQARERRTRVHARHAACRRGPDAGHAGGDGWATLTLVPNGQFPQPRNGYNVQFFVKAYRAGDPGLGGIAGYRLVQVRLASGA